MPVKFTVDGKTTSYENYIKIFYTHFLNNKNIRYVIALTYKQNGNFIDQCT